MKLPNIYRKMISPVLNKGVRSSITDPNDIISIHLAVFMDSRHTILQITKNHIFFLRTSSAFGKKSDAHPSSGGSRDGESNNLPINGP